MKFITKALLVILTLSTNVYSSDEEKKIEAAKRYLATTPMSDLIKDSATKIAAQLPTEQQQIFITLMTEKVNIPLLEKNALDAMANTFTLEELNAFADFYGSEVGKSAMSKFGTYMAIMQPVIQQEVFRAVQEIQGRTK